MNFDEIIDRRGTHCSKWDAMESIYGLSAEDGIPMWVADMDFRPPEVVRDALQKVIDHGIFGYFGDSAAYLDSIRWWMRERHGWDVDTGHIFSTHGLVNGTGMCVETFSDPGDGVVLFTPVYHAFARVIRSAGREVIEMPLTLEDGRYGFDFDAYDARMTGREKIVILCSPHNPGGRVWTQEELRAVADFAKRHDLILISDEIHADLVFAGAKHTAMPLAAPDVADRLVMMTAATKTFNLAGIHMGNVIIADPDLHRRFSTKMAALGISPNAFAPHAVTAAYSPEGAEWLDALMEYLDGNRKVFDEGIAQIPGLQSMPLEATYLAWVDFANTGMAEAEVRRRILEEAKIAVNHGVTFGSGGETFQRFNLATPRARVEEAVARMQRAFADLQ